MEFKPGREDSLPGFIFFRQIPVQIVLGGAHFH
jgi:hypothetical protein